MQEGYSGRLSSESGWIDALVEEEYLEPADGTMHMYRHKIIYRLPMEHFCCLFEL